MNKTVVELLLVGSGLRPHYQLLSLLSLAATLMVWYPDGRLHLLTGLDSLIRSLDWTQQPAAASQTDKAQIRCGDVEDVSWLWSWGRLIVVETPALVWHDTQVQSTVQSTGVQWTHQPPTYLHTKPHTPPVKFSFSSSCSALPVSTIQNHSHY